VVVGGQRQGCQVADDFSGEDITEDMILTHLEEISTRFSLKKAAVNEPILECVSYADDAGLYNRPFCLSVPEESPATDRFETGHLMSNDTYPEDIWEKAYKDRRYLYKRVASGTGRQLGNRELAHQPLVATGWLGRHAQTSGSKNMATDGI
jgi:hypothetical protein